MTIANLEQLCNAFCEIAEFEPPLVEPDDNGTLAFSVRMRGVPVTFAQSDDIDPGIVYLMVEAGPVPEAEAPRGRRTLLELNRRLLGDPHGVFSGDHESGGVVLHARMALAQATASEAYTLASRMVERVLAWQANEQVVADGAEGKSAPVPAELGARIESFCSLASERMPPGVRFDAVALPGLPLDRVGAIVAFEDVTPDDDDDQHLALLLEDNFASMASEHAPVFSCDPQSGRLLRQFICPLDGSGIAALVADIDECRSLLGRQADRAAQSERHPGLMGWLGTHSLA